jgi:hypothetical protein
MGCLQIQRLAGVLEDQECPTLAAIIKSSIVQGIQARIETGVLRGAPVRSFPKHIALAIVITR